MWVHRGSEKHRCPLIVGYLQYSSVKMVLSWFYKSSGSYSLTLNTSHVAHIRSVQWACRDTEGIRDTETRRPPAVFAAFTRGEPPLKLTLTLTRKRLGRQTPHLRRNRGSPSTAER